MAGSDPGDIVSRVMWVVSISGLHLFLSFLPMHFQCLFDTNTPSSSIFPSLFMSPGEKSLDMKVRYGNGMTRWYGLWSPVQESQQPLLCESSLHFVKPSCLSGIETLWKVASPPHSPLSFSAFWKMILVVENRKTKHEDMKVKVSRLQGSSDLG